MKENKIEKPEDKLKKENKEIHDKLKKENKEIHDKLNKEIKTLKKEARPYIAYGRLILTAAKSEHEPKEVVEGLKFAAKQINKENWPLVDRVGGTSGDLMARGSCPKCEINLVGKDLKPREFTMPCVIKDCPFNEKEIEYEKSNNK